MHPPPRDGMIVRTAQDLNNEPSSNIPRGLGALTTQRATSLIPGLKAERVAPNDDSRSLCRDMLLVEDQPTKLTY